MAVIALVSARPSDYDDIDSGKLSYGLRHSEQHDYSDESNERENPNSYSASGIFTKYPDSPQDEYSLPIDIELPTDETRTKRQTYEKDPSIDVNKQASNESEAVKRTERKTDEQTISLRSFISSIESDLVSRAQLINANVRLRRSLSAETTENGTSNENVTNAPDVNKDLFDGIFEYTRPQRESESEKDAKIPLDGLVQAVESTFIKSAQKIKSKRDVKEIEEQHGNKRDVDEPKEDRFSSGNYQVKKLTSSNNHDLNLLNPITFKAVDSLELSATVSQSCNDDAVSTTEFSPLQPSNLSLIQSSDFVHLVPDADKKLAYVQHQQIQQTVFHSNLAIFPTIPPQTINVPLLLTTTTEEIAELTTLSTSTPEKPQSHSPHRISLENAEKLKEKIAEIQAEPVIFSQV